ncbi:hypothetical protein Pcinc_032419 [Petrolisthes cinctipes]|uniref:Uncharacterized protein n=1 Tax=Petrolisthes cinctipes TaxID=88211 RepID=A0AAE1K314_PETCI|nr:hypothetical protein Pcinc_032419 [Petrolisthes cinctipes]
MVNRSRLKRFDSSSKFSLCLAKDKLKELSEGNKAGGVWRTEEAVRESTSPLFKKSKNLKKLSLSMNKEALMSKTKIFQDKTENNLTPFDLHTGSLQMSKHATQEKANTPY